MILPYESENILKLFQVTNCQVDDLLLVQVKNYHDDDARLFHVMTAQMLFQIHDDRSNGLQLLQARIYQGDGQMMIYFLLFLVMSGLEDILMIRGLIKKIELNTQ